MRPSSMQRPIHALLPQTPIPLQLLHATPLLFLLLTIKIQMTFLRPLQTTRGENPTLNEITQARDHIRPTPVLLMRADHLQMIHNRLRGISHEAQLQFTQPTRPCLSITHAESTNCNPAPTADRDAREEAQMRGVDDVLALTEAVVLGQVRDDEGAESLRASGILGVWIARVQAGVLADVVADAVFLGDDAAPEPEGVPVYVYAVILETEGPGGFGEDVLRAAVEEGDHASLSVEAEGPQLRQRSEGGVMGGLREELTVDLCPGGDGGLVQEARALRQLAVPKGVIVQYIGEGGR